MTALETLPSNLNYLSVNNFQFFLKKTPNLNFFCQKATIPGIALPAVDTPTPFVVIPQYGDHLDFAPLEIEFMIDEQMANYMEIHNWMRKTGFATAWSEFASIKNLPVTLGEGLFSDGEITIFDSVKNPRFSVTFQNMFPIALGGIEFKTTNTDATYAVCSCTFRYMLYNITALV
jgi:hypothetical protein